jgi:hypothetical protein
MSGCPSEWSFLLVWSNVCFWHKADISGSKLLLCNLTFSRVAPRGTQPVFMWCRILDVGAHQARSPSNAEIGVKSTIGFD